MFIYIYICYKYRCINICITIARKCFVSTRRLLDSDKLTLLFVRIIEYVIFPAENIKKNHITNNEINANQSCFLKRSLRDNRSVYQMI